jgi:putative DNA-invertase from lambdoid prophage Rac
MATYCYARVSTVRQSEDGDSLDVQRRQLAGYAQMHGLTLDEVFIERGVSGSKPLAERPQGRALLDTLKSGDVILTAKLDRMFRSALDALDVLGRLQKRGISLHMLDLGGDVTGNGISKLVFTILSAVAEAERDRIRERIVDVKRDQRSSNRYLGGKVPFGWRVDDQGGLQPVPAEQEALARMRALKAAGKPLRAIAATMQADGVQISHGGVAKALARSGKCGDGRAI